MIPADRQYVLSLAGFIAGSVAFLALLVLLVLWGGWKAAAVIGAIAGGQLGWFYRGARPDRGE